MCGTVQFYVLAHVSVLPAAYRLIQTLSQIPEAAWNVLVSTEDWITSYSPRMSKLTACCRYHCCVASSFDSCSFALSWSGSRSLLPVCSYDDSTLLCIRAVCQTVPSSAIRNARTTSRRGRFPRSPSYFRINLTVTRLTWKRSLLRPLACFDF